MRIGVSLTTFNRLSYLKKALNAYSALSRVPDELIVVNNGSTDGTKEFLDSWVQVEEGYKKTVIHSAENTGGSGGFFQGLQYSATQELDWVLVSDDDAYPDRYMLQNMENFISNDPTAANLSAVCAAVLYREDDKTSPHIVRHKKNFFSISTERVGAEEYKSEFFPIDTITFVGALINVEAIKKVGLPERYFFIYHDDSEYAMQLSRYGSFVCVPNATIIHDCSHSVDIRGTWKAYYELRNRIIMYKKHYPPRYWIWLVFSQYIKRISIVAILIKQYNKEERTLYRKAICDGINNRQGLDALYKPGYSCRTHK